VIVSLFVLLKWEFIGSTRAVAAGLALAVCNSSDSNQQWTFASSHLVQKSTNGCAQIPDCKQGPRSPGDAAIVADCSSISGNCDGANAMWSLNSNKTITSVMDGNCLDVYEGHGPGVYPHVCNGQTNQQYVFNNLA
jgi:hypothetical protein